MILAVDIGNSRTKFGVFDGNSLLSKWSVATADLGSAVHPADGKWSAQISAAIACSVVPSAEPVLVNVVEDSFDVDTRFVRNTDDLGLAVAHRPIEAIGTDRILAAVAAVETHGAPCVVISFGTATTIDVVNHQKELIGGLIAAGVTTSVKALAANTARLPEVEIVRPGGPVNVTTETAIQAGLFYAQVGLVESAIKRMGEDVTGAKVIATGGFADLIAPVTQVIDLVEDDLVLKGLNFIAQRGGER